MYLIKTGDFLSKTLYIWNPTAVIVMDKTTAFLELHFVYLQHWMFGLTVWYETTSSHYKCMYFDELFVSDVNY